MDGRVVGGVRFLKLPFIFAHFAPFARWLPWWSVELGTTRAIGVYRQYGTLVLVTFARRSRRGLGHIRDRGCLKRNRPRSLGPSASDVSGDSGRPTDKTLFSWVDHEVKNLESGSPQQALGVLIAEKNGAGGFDVFDSNPGNASLVLPFRFRLLEHKEWTIAVGHEAALRGRLAPLNQWHRYPPRPRLPASRRCGAGRGRWKC